MPDWAAIRASGLDAESFLQGQLSSDLRLLTPERAQWSSWSSPKGRMLALPLLLRDATGAIELWMPSGLIEPVLKRMRMFVLRAKVTLEDARAPRGAIGVIGGEAARWLTRRDWPAPTERLQVAQAGELQVLRAEGGSPRFLVVGAAARIGAVATDTDVDTWRAADIEAGVPVVYPQTQDRWVAQMTNLDLLGGISFDKGCYTGQEIVARLHYLGALKKRMFLLRGAGPVPAAGDEVFDTAGDRQAVGDIVDAVTLGDGFVASAVLQLSRRDSTTLRVGSLEGTPADRPQAYRGVG
ncbi:MAG: CAF17-like 4Fe-4S cluster assembly/insertion protein YgfZ [Panacagrimonas sp.]